MNFGTPQTEDETGIELTPLIDVVFLLLIFFMISTTFTKETKLQINLPESSGEPVSVEPQTIEVHISATSEYAIAADDEASSRALINSNRDTLVSALSEFQELNEPLLVIRADRKAPHDAVIKVLDVAQQLGLTNVTFATKQVSQ